MSGVEAKLTASLDDLIAQATRNNKEKRPAKPAPAPANRPPPQTGPRKGLKKNKPEQPRQQPQQQQQQQQRPRQQQQQPKPQVQQQPQQRPRAPKQLPGQRKSGAPNLGVREGQVQKRSVQQPPQPRKVLREQPPLQQAPPPRRAPYAQRQPAPEGKWQHDMYEDDYVPPRRAPAAPAAGNSAKLIIRNLYHGVTSDDLLELFSTVGEVKRHGVQYDNSGRSVGTGYVEFATRAEAEKAKKEYDGVMLDNQPMEILFGDQDRAAGGVPKKLASGITVVKPGAAGGQGAGPKRAGGEGRANGGQRLAAAALRETAAPARGPRGGSLGGRSGRLRSEVRGRSQNADGDYMQE
ncbi:hypothetical protein GPECTOR_77g43 [Gonium pectorale]|uniref:RRM domain-containing protein n=1 Tax=Gonium pectorale TaxID=33097 RepID=A0A150G268_GONPE|nr:hypothetical protein GPECTOR_77g43 [Gonium pectorale]|eukprot:KXZ43947.1 hypothetical protein GPECTOR_77g43 [Gonium pectorale]